MAEFIGIVVIFLLFSWVAWRRLDWAVALCIFLTPAYLIRFQVWFVPMTVLEILILIVFVVWFVKSVRRGVKASATPGSKLWPSIFGRIFGPWKWLLVFWVLAGVLAVVVSPDTRQALGLWKAYIVEPVLFFIVFVNTIRTEKQVRYVMLALGALVLMIGYVSLLQYVGLLDIPEPYGSQSPIRATSVFPFPTAVGKLIGPLVALFLGLWLTKAKTIFSTLWDFVRRNIFIGGVLVFGAMALLFSFSRGAIIGALASLVFISFFSVWKKWIWIILIILVIMSMIMPFTRQELLSVFSVKDTSADVHVVMWKGAVRIIKVNPILGTGLASFPVVYEQFKEASHTEFFPNPDHLVLTLWIEMGLAGLVMFTWIVIRFFKTGFSLAKRLRTTDYGLPLAVGLMGAMVTIIVHGFFDTPYFKNDLAVEFWVLIGLIVVLGKIVYNDDESTIT